MWLDRDGGSSWFQLLTITAGNNSNTAGADSSKVINLWQTKFFLNFYKQDQSNKLSPKIEMLDFNSLLNYNAAMDTGPKYNTHPPQILYHTGLEPYDRDYPPKP